MQLINNSNKLRGLEKIKNKHSLYIIKGMVISTYIKIKYQGSYVKYHFFLKKSFRLTIIDNVRTR